MAELLRCNACGRMQTRFQAAECDDCGSEDCSLITLDDKHLNPKQDKITSWFSRGRKFTVEAKRCRWEHFGEEYWHWCLYVHLFDGWPGLEAVRAKILEPRFHGGESYRHEEPYRITIGCDYNHLGDDYYRRSEDVDCIRADFVSLYLWARSFEEQNG